MINSFIKRAFDILICSICLVVFFVPMGLIIVSMLLAQGRPIFFKQLRPGKNEKPFELIKFRTMVQDPNQYDAKNIQISDEERLTKIGRMLRSTSLDELPSLINVLRGEMSLVGPRPLLMHYLKIYSKEHAKRHLVKPGVTGWAQVNGRNAISWPQKLELDVWYVENQSFLLDLKILILTITKVLKKDGIGSYGESTGEEFKGYNE